MKRRHLFKTILPLLVALATVGSNVRAAELLGIDFDGVLYDINLTTGAATNPRPTGVPTLSGLAWSPTAGLYAHDAATNSLFRLNRLTGEATRIGSLGLDATEGDLAFHPLTGVLYGSQTAGSDRLYTIDIQSGQATVIGSVLSGGDLSAMAFNRNGELFGIDTSNHRILKIDPLTAQIIGQPQVIQGNTLGATAGMAFDPDAANDLNAWVVGRSSSYPGGDPNNPLNPLYALTLENGFLRPGSRNTGLADGLSGLTFVPEPSSLALLAVGFLLIQRPRRTSVR
ncbi:MAG: hypothetical protein KF841_10530 [Phycisphaerae bacterium]|nr:hypothetical protein [Phycisphaerae bacterium]